MNNYFSSTHKLILTLILQKWPSRTAAEVEKSSTLTLQNVES
jgi:hypothetical protein